MAYQKNPYLKTYSELLGILKKESVPNNILLFSSDKVVYEEFIRKAGEKFIGKDYNKKEHFTRYYSDDVPIETLVTECSNLGFFTEKKIICYKLVKRAGTRGGLKKDDLSSLVNYAKNPNPDTILILLVTDVEYLLSSYSGYAIPDIRTFAVKEPSETDLAAFVKKHIDGYSMTDQAISVFLSFLAPSYDSVFAELEKLKVYTVKSKTIDLESINLCIGISRDFDEIDFVEAILSRNAQKALKIYDNITLRDDVEILLLYHIMSAFLAIYKLSDPDFQKNVQNPYKELRIYKNIEKVMPIYKKYMLRINELKIKSAFDYICRTDKAMKSTETNKRALFTALITELVLL